MTSQAIGSFLKIVLIDSIFVLCFSMTDEYSDAIGSLCVLYSQMTDDYSDAQSLMRII
jgi:hypothetical protein